MGAVVLHGDVPARQGARELAAAVAGMRVVRDHERVPIDLVDLAQIACGGCERVLRREMIEIAEVLARKGLNADDERQGALQVAAERQDRLRRGERRHRARREAARAAQHDARAVRDAHDRVVDAARDRPFADQERVRDAAEALERFAVAIGDRFARTVPARHHERVRRAGRKKQMVQGRVGQHHAEIAIVRRDPGEFHLRTRDHDRTFAREQRTFGIGGELDEFARSREVAHHQREGPFFTVLALAQRDDRRRIARVAGEMVAAEPFERDDGAARKQCGCLRDRLGSANAPAA